MYFKDLQQTLKSIRSHIGSLKTAIGGLPRSVGLAISQILEALDNDYRDIEGRRYSALTGSMNGHIFDGLLLS